MKRVYAFWIMSFPFLCLAQEVKKGNFNSVTKLEQVISGHLTDLNGKYKLRVTETTYLAGGYIGEHHHVGPGVRFVKSGELTYIQDNLTRVFKEGDYFYESGDVTHTAYNKGSKPVVIINFEVLPADWRGASPIPVPNQDTKPLH